MVKMSTVWDRTTEFLGQHGAVVWPIAILGVAVPSTITGVIEPVRLTASAGTQSALGFAGLLLTIVTFWAGAAISAAAADPALGRGAVALATRRFLPLIGITLLLVLGSALLILPIFVILGASGFDFAAAASASDPTTMPSIPPGAALAVGLYALALLPLMLWLVARLAVLTPVVMLERNGIGAIARGWRLTKGHGLRIAGILLLYIVVAVIASLAVVAALGSIFQIVAGGEGITLAVVLTALVSAVVTTLLTVVQSAFVGRLYAALAPARSLEAEFA